MHELVLSVVVGSHANGLAIPESDVDRRGVFSARAGLLVVREAGDELHRAARGGAELEVEQFCHLALRANPTVLETLASDRVEVCTPLDRSTCPR